MVPQILVLSALFSLALAKPHARSMKVHESRQYTPSGFVKTGSAHPDTPLNLRIALAKNDPKGLIDALYAVSTPDSPSYGEHLSKEEVETFVSPSQKSLDAVNAWLTEAGVTATAASPAGDWLSLSVPVSKANELFDADFSIYKHADTGKEAIRTLSYSIPTELHDHLELVHPTISFPNPHGVRPIISTPSKRAIRSEPETVTSNAICSGNGITPACVQSLYGIPSDLAKSKTNRLGVCGMDEQYAQQADLTTFLKKYRPDLDSSTTFALETVDNGSNEQNPGLAGWQANLDIQYTVGLASGVPTTFISESLNWQDGELEGFLDIINYLLGETNPPQVLTSSYRNTEDAIPQALANNLCTAYAQLGARGTSIIFASGDSGVGTYNHNDEICTTFVPTFPSGCPFLTSVGATDLEDVPAETAAVWSSGGFSNYFDIPSYQSSAVKSYLASIGSKNKGLFNVSGRAFPDVAAIGSNLEVFVGNQLELIDGTSASSPIFASIIALITSRKKTKRYRTIPTNVNPSITI